MANWRSIASRAAQPDGARRRATKKPSSPPTSGSIPGSVRTKPLASGAIPALKVVTKRITLDEAVPEGFDALLDPAGTQLKILIDLT